MQAQSLRNFSETSGFATRTANPEAFDANYSYDANGNLLTLQRFDLQGQLQDDFVYQYQSETNRLASVSDAVPPQTITYDTKVYDQGPIQSDGKVYRQITVEGTAEVAAGQSVMLQANELIHLKQNFHAQAGSGFHAKWTDEATAASETLDDNSTFTYDAIGNLIADSGEGTSITWTPYGKVRSVNHSDGTVVNYRYDATGNRVEKQVIGTDSTLVTRYIRDASGNVLAIYENDQLSEQPIYGSSRLGTYAGQTTPGEQQLGHRKYELSNHLGNVLSVITDNVNMNADSTWATLVSAQDVFPFGLEMQGRAFNSGAYCYGFNGFERDNEIAGSGSIYTTTWRPYDSKLGRWWAVDPKETKYPSYSPYSFALNSPMILQDPAGDTVRVTVTNNMVGFTQIRLYSSGEIQADPSRANMKAWVPVYEVAVNNESGENATYYFTRYAERAVIGSDGTATITDVTFDTRRNGDSFAGVVKSRWSGTNNVLELRPSNWGSLSSGQQTIAGMKSFMYADRTAIQMHALGASDGCLMCALPSNIVNPFGVTIDATGNGSQTSFMNTITNFRSQDAENGFSDYIDVSFERVNMFGKGSQDAIKLDRWRSMIRHGENNQTNTEDDN